MAGADVQENYKQLLSSNLPLQDVLQNLFRESARQQIEIDQLEKVGRPSADHRRTYRNLTSVILRLMRDFPKDRKVSSRSEVLDAMMMLLIQTPEPMERLQIFRTVETYLTLYPNETLNSFNSLAGHEIIRALQKPELAPAAQDVLQHWARLNDVPGEMLLEESGLARLQNNTATLGALESAVQVLPTQKLLEYLFSSEASIMVRFESLRLLAEKPALPSIDTDWIDHYGLYTMLSDPDHREDALGVIRKLLENVVRNPTEEPRTAENYKTLFFNDYNHGFITQLHSLKMHGDRKNQEDATPAALEGSTDKRNAIVQALIERMLIAQAVGDTPWVTKLKSVVTPLLSDPQVILGLLSATTNDGGNDVRDYAMEETVAEALSLLSEDTLFHISIHDPRLVMALIRMKYRLNQKIANSARRALSHMYIDSTEEAKRAAVDESESRTWADISDERQQIVSQLKDLIIQTHGDIGRLDELVSATPSSPLVPMLQRMREYAATDSKSWTESQYLGSEYKDVEAIFLCIQEELEAERNPDQRHALLLFFDYLNRKLVKGHEFSAHFLATLVKDMNVPEYALAAAHILGQSDRFTDPDVFQFISIALGPQLSAASTSGSLETNEIFQAIGQQLERLPFDRLLPILRASDSNLAVWVLKKMDFEERLSDPRVISWFAEKLGYPVIRPIALKRLESVDDPLTNFRNEVMVERLNDTREAQSFEPLELQVWIRALNQENADHALALLDATRDEIQIPLLLGGFELPPETILCAFRRSLENSNPDIQSAAVRVMQRVTFPNEAAPVSWLEGLLDMRISAALEANTHRVAAIETVLDTTLQHVANRNALRAIATSTHDIRIRNEANRLLALAAIPDDGSVKVVGFGPLVTMEVLADHLRNGRVKFKDGQWIPVIQGASGKNEAAAPKLPANGMENAPARRPIPRIVRAITWLIALLYTMRWWVPIAAVGTAFIYQSITGHLPSAHTFFFWILPSAVLLVALTAPLRKRLARSQAARRAA
jgi:hypothetical protein